jgi:hypothetical protein
MGTGTGRNTMADQAFSLNKVVVDMSSAVPDLLAQRAAAKDKRVLRQLSARIKSARMLVRWAKSRAGYVDG